MGTGLVAVTPHGPIWLGAVDFLSLLDIRLPITVYIGLFKLSSGLIISVFISPEVSCPTIVIPGDGRPLVPRCDV
jgi:hypothetical protein